MSVLIKGMKMPETCLDCPMYDCYNYHCQMYALGIPARYNRNWSTVPEWCELVELPEKHGDLIDRDALDLEQEVELADDWKTAHEIANVVKYAPVVIEAEGEE